eukprot:4252459-Pyramimonas_sp.AAC.1
MGGPSKYNAPAPHGTISLAPWNGKINMPRPRIIVGVIIVWPWNELMVTEVVVEAVVLTSSSRNKKAAVAVVAVV